MSKFERSDAYSAWADARELQFSDDFSPEDAAFAKQLHEFFAIDDEELPPLYAQTLLEEERFPILDVDFEQRIIDHVFGMLELKADPAERFQHLRYPIAPRPAHSSPPISPYCPDGASLVSASNQPFKYQSAHVYSRHPLLGVYGHSGGDGYTVLCAGPPNHPGRNRSGSGAAAFYPECITI